MFTTLLAHVGHTHDMEMNGMSDIDHCMPIIIGAGLIIVVLLGIIAFLLMRGHAASSPAAKPVSKKKK